MKKLIPVFSLISFLCFTGSVFAQDAPSPQAPNCEVNRLNELKEKRNNLVKELNAVKQELRKCGKEKRAQWRLKEAKTKNPI
jgi:hypothetical protein